MPLIGVGEGGMSRDLEAGMRLGSLREGELSNLREQRAREGEVGGESRKEAFGELYQQDFKAIPKALVSAQATHPR